MATLDPTNRFQSFVLTKEERIQGTILNYLQIACIKNQIATLAMEKVSLTFAEENRQREAELQGSIGSLEYLLSLSEAAEQEARELASSVNQPSSTF